MYNNIKKKGFTLIEVIATIAIFMVISSVSLNITIGAIKDYLLYIDNSVELDNLDNCMINIDNILRSKMITDIGSDGDSISVIMKLSHISDSVKKKIIYIKNNNLMVKTLVNDKDDITTGNNVLLKGVNEFNIYIKGELIYFSLTTKKGEVRIRCL